MPLKSLDYAKIVDLDIEIRDQYPVLKQSLILWKHYLVLSSMENEADAWIIHDYLTHPHTGKLDDGLISQVKDKGHVSLTMTKVSANHI